ncbi:MAG: ArsR/SmtB family transcription factor [Brotaphodocola sp.]
MVTGKFMEQTFTECKPLFIALGDEVRLKIIGLLYTTWPDGLNVNEITSQTSLSRPAVSHHLKILKDAGLVDVHRKGTSNIYYQTPKEGTRKLMQLGSLIEEFYKE